MDFANRRQRIVAEFDALQIDAFVTSRDIHVRYLTNLASSNAAVLVTPNQSFLFTDGRYALMAQQRVTDCEIVVERHGVTAAIRQAAEVGVTRLGFESMQFSVDEMAALHEVANEVGVVLVAVTEVVEKLRLIKDDFEIDAISQACHITDRAWEQVIADGVIGKSERELAGLVEMYFRKFGAEDRAFESIVATGPNSAIPHHHPTGRIVERGDLLKMDCGAKVDGYHSDMTRTVVVGKAAAWQVEIYGEVNRAQQAAMNACRPGAEAFDMDAVARSLIEAAGYGKTLVHQIGHGVGLEIHEKPFLGRRDGILQPRMPITVEPGIYLEGRGGVRIEDTILIVADGHRRLTESTRDLLEV